MKKSGNRKFERGKSDFFSAFYISLAVFIVAATIAGIIIVNTVRF